MASFNFDDWIAVNVDIIDVSKKEKLRNWLNQNDFNTIGALTGDAISYPVGESWFTPGVKSAVNSAIAILKQSQRHHSEGT